MPWKVITSWKLVIVAIELFSVMDGYHVFICVVLFYFIYLFIYFNLY